MKLSEIKGERVFDVIAEIIAPICRIAQSDAAKELTEKKRIPEGKTPTQAAAERLSKCVPVLLREHKQDMIRILAAMEGISYTEYVDRLNIATLLFDVKELIEDEALIELFTSAQSENSSGSVQANMLAGL